MKLTHRDFRPLRRSKYVAQPLKRRPTLRILALAALGIAVYLKYDSVVHSQAFQNLSQPGRFIEAMLHRGAPPTPAIAAEGLIWSADSMQVDAECRDAMAAPCLDRWISSLGPEAIGALRGTLAKASMQLGVEASKGFKARFLRGDPASDPLEGRSSTFEMVRLEIRGEKETLALERSAGNAAASLCDKRRCLDSNPPKAPLARFRVIEVGPESAREGTDPAGPEHSRLSGTVLSLAALDGPKVFPILRGRVVDVPAPFSADQWVKVYHGGNLFSFYRGLSSLDPAIKAGAMIEPGAILGLMSSEGDSAGVLDLRIEKGGIAIDPLGFLGISPQAVAAAPGPETIHAR